VASSTITMMHGSIYITLTVCRIGQQNISIHITSLLQAPHSFTEWLATFYGSQKLSSTAASICFTCYAKWRHAMHAVYADKQTITQRQHSELRSNALSLQVTCFHVFVYLLQICIPAYTITDHSHLHDHH